MSETDSPGDAMLLAQLESAAERAGGWARLLAVAQEFADLPHAEDDFGWRRLERRADGEVVGGYPVYGTRVEQARRALVEIGAVTPAYPWMQQPLPAMPTGAAGLSPADGVRLATAIVRGERLCDGTIGQAVEQGVLQAVLASLATWYQERPGT